LYRNHPLGSFSLARDSALQQILVVVYFSKKVPRQHPILTTGGRYSRILEKQGAMFILGNHECRYSPFASLLRPHLGSRPTWVRGSGSGSCAGDRRKGCYRGPSRQQLDPSKLCLSIREHLSTQRRALRQVQREMPLRKGGFTSKVRDRRLPTTLPMGLSRRGVSNRKIHKRLQRWHLKRVALY